MKHGQGTQNILPLLTLQALHELRISPAAITALQEAAEV